MESRNGVRRHRLARWAWQLRAAIGGLLFGGAMLAIRLGDDDLDLLTELVLAALAGLAFGIATGLFQRSYERRLFSVDGRTATPDERITILRAVDSGRWPHDPRLHPATLRVAEQHLRGAGKPASSIATFIVMIAVSLVNVALNGPWWWLAVALWAITGPWLILISRRGHAGALALRASGPAPATIPAQHPAPDTTSP